MASFRLDLPATVLFGPGTLGDLPRIARRHGDRLLLLTGSAWLERAGHLARIRASLAGAAIEHVACPPGEPTTASVEEVRRRSLPFRPQAIVAVGGGSVIDTAKALSGVLGLAEPVERFCEAAGGGLAIPAAGVPWIAVPTTAGTGAEVTKNAVLKLPGKALKRSIRSPFLVASSVVVDPELTRDLPMAVTGIGGLDALTQLVEAYVARTANPYTSSLVRGAFLPLLDALERLPGSPTDIALRTDASYGALASGFALAGAGLGAAHGFAAGLGGMYDIPHGLLCAVFLPHVLEANAEVIRGKVAELAGGRNGRADAVRWLADTVRRLLGLYGLPADLRRYHVAAERVSEVVERSAGSSMAGNPRDLDRAEQERIVRLALGGGQ